MLDLILALVTRAKEAAGHDLRLLSGLLVPERGLSLFRWVFPRFHHKPAIEAWRKRQPDPST